MKIKVISALCVICLITGNFPVAFAGIETAEVDGNNILLTGTSSSNAAGEKFSLMLHNLYNKENPAASVVVVEQGTSGENGKWTYTIPLADSIGDGSYTLRYGDSLGVAQEVDLTIDRSTDVSVEIDEAGHIFFDPTKIEVKAILSGTSTESTNDIVARVYTEEDNTLILDEVLKTVSLKPQERFADTLTIDLSKGKKQYGMFVLKLAMVPQGTKVTDGDFKTQIRFSVAKKSDTPNEKIGMHTQFGHGYADSAINTRLLKNAGYSGIRDYVAYSQCFSKGEWNEPERYNKWVGNVKNNGLSQIIELGSANEGFPKTEAEIQNFTNYAVALVSNLTKDGVYCYELWNEPNWSYTAEEYANLLISVAPAIKAVDRENVKMLAFSVAGVSNFHSVNWIVDVINILKEKNLDPHDYIDYISVHPYKPLNQYPEKSERTCNCTYGTESFPAGASQNDTNDTIPGDSSVTARMDNLTNRLKDVGCEDIPFIATEIGWYSYIGDSGQTTCERCLENGTTDLDEIGQAQYSVRAAALLYNKIEKIYFHTLNNKPSKNSNWEKNFGFIENWNPNETEIPYEAKPVFIAMANFNSIIGNANLVQEIKDGTTYDYIFIKDGKKYHMMWTTDAAAKKAVNTDDMAITVYDMYGNIVDRQYSDDGIYNLSLSQSPVYVEETSVITEIKILDAQGSAVTNLDKATRFCAAMETLSTTKEAGMLICAVYKDNLLVELKTTPVTAGVRSAKTEYADIKDADMIRAFYWKTTNNIPCCEAVNISKQQKQGE